MTEVAESDEKNGEGGTIRNISGHFRQFVYTCCFLLKLLHSLAKRS